jgi:molybdenum cofactor cytidylyltransferase
LSEAALRIAAVVLAAGRSTRMGAQNKLVADVGGTPMVRRVVEAALASRAAPVLVVTGHMADAVSTVLTGIDVVLVANPNYATGLASSLEAGIRALPAGCDGALILLGDMPRIAPAHIDRLIAAFGAGDVPRIVVPVHEGRRGNPVLWPAAFFPELLGLEGDAGAKRLLATHAARVHEIDLATGAIFADIDTPDDLARLRGA